MVKTSNYWRFLCGHYSVVTQSRFERLLKWTFDINCCNLDTSFKRFELDNRAGNLLKSSLEMIHDCF
jgi:hypothetical protein